MSRTTEPKQRTGKSASARPPPAITLRKPNDYCIMSVNADWYGPDNNCRALAGSAGSDGRLRAGPRREWL
jgi:hypothetical protein